MIHAFSKIVRTEGLLRGWRGWPAVAVGAGPAHAVYFTSYEYTKKILDGRLYGGDAVLHGKLLTSYHIC